MLATSVYGADRVRTDDLLLAKQVLSQLSYSPENFSLKNFPSHALAACKITHVSGA